VEKARIQRLLFRRSAELGSRLYELARTGGETGGSEAMPNPLGDGTVKSLLLEISKLDEAMKNAEGQIAKGTDEVPEA
jgi:transcriptional regulator of nitric oxide reductase